MPKHGGHDAGLHVYLADPVVGVVADVEVAPGVEREVLRVVERGVLLRASVARVAAEAQCGPGVRAAAAALGGMVAGVLAGEELDDAGGRVDPADVVCPLAGQVQVAVVVDGDAAVGVHLRLDGRTAVAAAAGLAGPGYAGDDACLVVDASVCLIAQVRQVEVTVLVLREIVRAVETGVDRGAAVAGAAWHTVSGEPVEDAAAVDAPQDMGVVVRHDQVAVRPADDAERPPRVRVPGRYAVAEPGSGDRRYRTRAKSGQRFVHSRPPPSGVRGTIVPTTTSSVTLQLLITSAPHM